MPDGREPIELKLVENICDLDPAQWDRCVYGPETPPGAPFLSYSFLNALELSRSATGDTGWLPRHLVLQDEAGELLSACPLYVKNHSQGEYVFDHNWAHA